jgi:lysozyme family protein
MADFTKAIGVILNHEGGLVDHPSDPGGITNFGISMKFVVGELKADGDKDGFLDGDFDHDGQITRDDIKNMNVHQAVDIYKRYWWDKFHYELFKDDDVATKVFDCSVNMGDPRAHKLAQKAANDCGTQPQLVVDGDLGSRSFHGINEIDPQEFVKALCRQQAAFYKSLVDQKPSMGVFLKGWLARAAWPFKQIP